MKKASVANLGFKPPRQCNRSEVHLDFCLGGMNKDGKVFEESVVTRNLSECGGSFTSPQALNVGSTLKLFDHSGHTGFISLIRVAWSKKILNSKLRIFGFQFVYPSSR
jgi:hypothetical protein